MFYNFENANIENSIQVLEERKKEKVKRSSNSHSKLSKKERIISIFTDYSFPKKEILKKVERLVGDLALYSLANSDLTHIFGDKESCQQWNHFISGESRESNGNPKEIVLEFEKLEKLDLEIAKKQRKSKKVKFQEKLLEQKNKETSNTFNYSKFQSLKTVNAEKSYIDKKINRYLKQITFENIEEFANDKNLKYMSTVEIERCLRIVQRMIAEEEREIKSNN